MITLKARLFKGGVHPPDSKEAAENCPLQRLPLPTTLTVSLQQHLGAPASPIVNVGDRVVKYQRIGEAQGFISAHVHAPATGVVKAITECATITGRKAPAVVIETDPSSSEEMPLEPIQNWETLPPAELIRRIADAGIVGMGGAGFPTNVKLSPKKPIDTIILNGAECEPYLCTDNRMMLEHTECIIEGLRIMRYILGAKSIRVAIETNKQSAIEKMRSALAKLDGDVAFVPLQTRYPQGSEKQQIFSTTGRIVPAGGLPMDVGCVVENAGTVYAIRNAIVRGHTLIERAITVAAEAIAVPSNFIAPIGTPLRELILAAGGTDMVIHKLISGGPMMGFALPSLDFYTTKTMSGILLFPKERVLPYESSPCISCGRCVDACPLRLMPNEMSQAIEADDIKLAETLNVMDCFECGSCTYICPAHRPLVGHFRRAKAIIGAERRAAAAKKASK